MRLRFSFAALIVASLTLCLAGCWGGPSLPKTISASGKITYKGQPLKGASVLFISKTKGPLAQGVTDASGAFKLTTYKPGDGAVPGEYGVAVTAVSDSNPGAAYHGGPSKAKSLIPEKYGNTATSKLTATVAKGQRDFTFNLD